MINNASVNNKANVPFWHSVCESFEPEQYLFGLIKDTTTMTCKTREGVTLGQVREVFGLKKGEIRSINHKIVYKVPKGVKLDEFAPNGSVKIRERNLHIEMIGGGFGKTINGNYVYIVQKGDTKDKIKEFADVRGYPEYNLMPGTVLYVKKLPENLQVSVK